MNYDKLKVVHTDRAEDLTVIGQDVDVNGLINAIETKLKEKNERN
jgi:formyltetrahydrofolate hydrolase